MKSYNVSDVIAAKAYLSEKSAELQGFQSIRFDDTGMRM